MALKVSLNERVMDLPTNIDGQTDRQTDKEEAICQASFVVLSRNDCLNGRNVSLRRKEKKNKTKKVQE